MPGLQSRITTLVFPTVFDIIMQNPPSKLSGWISWSWLILLRVIPLWFIPFSFLGLLGCTADKTELVQTTLAPQSAPNCASCHAYPPRDTNHVYHLFDVEGGITNNRPITCLHCHNKSMLGKDIAFIDSIFLDPNGNEFHALDFPDIPEIRNYPLLRLDTLVQNRPVELASSTGSPLALAEWMTGHAHMNGKVDVDFDKTSIDTARFQGQSAFFHPEKLTCSAMACHPSSGDYRWAIPSKGLPILKGDEPLAP